MTAVERHGGQIHATQAVRPMHAEGPLRQKPIVRRDADAGQTGRIEIGHQGLEIRRCPGWRDVPAGRCDGQHFEAGVEQGHRQGEGIVNSRVHIDNDFASHGGIVASESRHENLSLPAGDVGTSSCDTLSTAECPRPQILLPCSRRGPATDGPSLCRIAAAGDCRRGRR